MLNLEIVTPEKKVFDESVETVTAPTATGEIGVLPNHAPLISALKAGILTYTTRNTTGKMVIAGGFVEINSDRVSVLTDIAETAEEVDVEAARLERDQTEKNLLGWNGTEAEFEAEKEKLEKAQARLALTAGK